MSRPALKVSIPRFVADGSIHFRLGGTLTSLEEGDGRVADLLEQLDGSRTPEEVLAALVPRFPDLTQSDVDGAIADLDDSGLLQDAADKGDDFSPAARERWSNNLGFFETYASLATSKYEFQRRIRDAKIAVLGVGGIGSHVLIDLVAIGFHDIRIVDFDRIELANFNRQIIYGEPDLGEVKVQVAAARAKALNGSVRIDQVEKRLTSAEDVYQVVRDRDVVVAVVDRPKTHVAQWVNEGCVRAGTALIGGGVDTQRAVHYGMVPGITGCLECWYSSVHANDPASRMVQDVMGEIDRTGASYGEDTSAFNGLVSLDAGMLVSEMVRMTSRVTPPLALGRMLGLTFQDPRLREMESWKPDPDCSLCGDVTPRDSFAWLAGGNLPTPF
jgi:molybdopterin/thiamine biosynthesis adenylyltransferase